MAGAGLITILGLLLIVLPIELAMGLGRGWRRWRAVPLVEKSHCRAGIGAFLLVALAIYTVKRGGFSPMVDVELYVVAGAAAFAMLWLGVGIVGSQGRLRSDPMQIFWLGVVGVGAVVLLSVKGWPL
jgi:hypothetical protein